MAFGGNHRNRRKAKDYLSCQSKGTDYLARLKARLGQRQLGGSPSKPPKDAFEGFEGKHDAVAPFPRLATARREGAEVVIFEERAPNIDAGASRKWADAFGRLHPDRPPRDVAFSQWRQFVDDCGLFMDRWAIKANALGWTLDNLVGWDLGRPFPLIAIHIGLGWHIKGGTVVDVTSNAATVLKPNGQKVIFRRPGSPSNERSGERRTTWWSFAT